MPPGDWDRKTLLSMSEIHELKVKKRQRLAAMEKLKQEKEISKKMSEVHLDAKPEVIMSSEKADLEKEMNEKKPEKVDDPLVRTSVPFGGMINELKKRFPLYKSDIVDSASLMCIAAIIFIFFAALSGAIAFGGLYGTYYLQLWSLEIV